MQLNHISIAVSAWDRFWFRPANPLSLAVIRVLTGLMLVYSHAVWTIELDSFFGPQAWVAPDVLADYQQDEFVYSFWPHVAEEYLLPCHLAAVFVFACFTIGLFSEITLPLAFILLLSYVHRLPGALFGLDQIIGLLTLYCAVGGAGKAGSLDSWLRSRRGTRVESSSLSVRSNIGLRLIQVHMCLIYLVAGLSKLQGTAWWDGHAMWLAFANIEYQSRDMTWLAEYPKLINLMTHVTVLWELFFCTLIWRPAIRPYMLLVGIALHCGIGAFLGMWTFGLIMLVGCVSFVPVQTLERILSVFSRFSRSHSYEKPSESAEMHAELQTVHAMSHSEVPIEN
ncbi:MAG: HTTM domain-containing protein [Planctomycetota bacterium]|nr:HTTM domain-containing protein [Planctomycetota bacterium]